MRLVRYRSAMSEWPRAGLVLDVRPSGVEVADVTAVLPFLSLDPVAELLALRDALEGLSGGTTGHPQAVLTWDELLAPIGRPGKLLCAAMNYGEHIREIGAPVIGPMNAVPKLFLKPPTCITSPFGDVPLPTVSTAVDWELELAVIIGRRGRNLRPDRALDVVGGYAVINDLSARSMSWGLADRQAGHWDQFFDWLMGKWPDGFAPFGPWVVTADEVPDPHGLELTLQVNGVTRQKGSTAQMIFSIAELISFASRFMTLEPGDVIATGTPSGVGATSGTFLNAGDVVQGEISAIGRIETRIVASVGEE